MAQNKVSSTLVPKNKSRTRDFFCCRRDSAKMKTLAHLFAEGASLCASLATVAQRDIHRTFCAILPYCCPGRLAVSADYVGIEKSLSRGQDTAERAS